MARFKDRVSGASELLQKLDEYRESLNTVVLGLPRGGLVTAAEIAKGLFLPLGYVVVKKMGAPGDPELAIGATDSKGISYFDQELIKSLGISKEYLDSEKDRKIIEAKERFGLYKSNFKNPDFIGKGVILVDDGIATGTSMLAAIKSVENSGAAKVVVAVPVVAEDSREKLQKLVDEFVAVEVSSDMMSVGEFYDYFPQVEDSEVLEILSMASARSMASAKKNAENNLGSK